MQPNPKLQSLAVLIGEWMTVGTHPMLPGRTLRGRTTFSWLESGAFLLAHMRTDEPGLPNLGVAVLGTDDATPDAGAMLYFDVRGVAREYRWTISGNVLTWSRMDPSFSQRNHLTIADDQRTIVSRGEMSRDGAPWEPDLKLTYTRIV